MGLKVSKKTDEKKINQYQNLIPVDICLLIAMKKNNYELARISLESGANANKYINTSIEFKDKSDNQSCLLEIIQNRKLYNLLKLHNYKIIKTTQV